jgi:hypothetical protein
MPPYNTGLLDGELAWRQHDGGHEDRSNMSFFIGWADRKLGRGSQARAAQATRQPDRGAWDGRVSEGGSGD